MSEQDETPGLDPDEPETDETETGDEPDEDAQAADMQDGDEQAEAPDPEPAPEPISEKEMEKAFKQLDKLRETNANRVGAIMGEDAQALIPCPCCTDVAPGFVFPPTVAPLSTEAEAGTRQLLGMNVRGQFKEHPNAILCETCDGLGSVETPSKVPGFDVVDCPECAATGRILTPTIAAVPQQGEYPPPAPILTGPTAPQPDLPPEAQALKDAGYLVIPPTTISAPAPNLAAV